MNLPAKHEVMQNMHTIADFIRLGASLFEAHQLYYGHGCVNAVDEAAFMVLSALHLPNDMSADYFDCHLLTAEKQKIWDYFTRRIKQHLPAAYITHQAQFCGLWFYVDKRVLIPRSPIAELIEKRFYPWLEEAQVERVLDLCTGSGCIAIACAYAFAHAQVDALDISDDALAVAKINRHKHQLDDYLRLIPSDLFNTFYSASNTLPQYDLIVSNPPYVDARDMQHLPAEYRAEPELGLAAGEDGLVLVNRILREAGRFLGQQGILVVEVGNSMEALVQKYPQVPFYWFEFEKGGDGVFLLTKEQLDSYFSESNQTALRQ